MEVYILLECTDQSAFTEPRYFDSASDSMRICGVYGCLQSAEKEKAKMEEQDDQLQEELDTDPCYYSIQVFQVQP